MTVSNVPARPQALGPLHRAARVRKLRALLAAPVATVAPGVTDALGALLVEAAGFDVCYVTGAGVANAGWALPDIGLLAMPELAATISRAAHATSLPIVADADDGYGGPLSVVRTLRQFEEVGAAGIQLEDQVAPKRCGHFERKRVIPAREMVAKVLAARRAATDGTVLIARTDAIAVEGFDAAVERAKRYRDAGADAIFVEAPEDTRQLEALPGLLEGVPLVANVVPGGKTPELSAGELGAIGFRLVVHANFLLRVMAKAGADALAQLRMTGDSRGLEAQLLGWEERQTLVQLAMFDGLVDDLRAEADRLMEGEGIHSETALRP